MEKREVLKSVPKTHLVIAKTGQVFNGMYYRAEDLKEFAAKSPYIDGRLLTIWYMDGYNFCLMLRLEPEIQPITSPSSVAEAEERIRQAAVAYLHKNCRFFPGRFTEIGSGLRMEPGKGYILSDSGSYYLSEGFKDIEEARRSLYAKYKSGDLISDLEEPAYDWESGSWKDAFEVSFVRAEHLWDFWVRDLKSFEEYSEYIRDFFREETALIREAFESYKARFDK